MQDKRDKDETTEDEETKDLKDRGRSLSDLAPTVQVKQAQKAVAGKAATQEGGKVKSENEEEKIEATSPSCSHLPDHRIAVPTSKALPWEEILESRSRKRH